MREPKVLTGARESRGMRLSRSEQSLGGRAALREQAALKVPDKVVFQSAVGKFRQQLTANETEYLPGGRAAKKPKDLVLEFTDGICILDTKKDAEKIALAMEHANFRGGSSGKSLFWLLKDEVDAKKAKANSEAANTLLTNTDALSDPGVRAKIVEALKLSGEDFDLGGRKPMSEARASA